MRSASSSTRNAQEMLLGKDLGDKAMGMFEEVLQPILETHAGDPDKPVAYDEVRSWMTHKFGGEIDLDGLERVDRDELFDWLVKRVELRFAERKEHYGDEDWERIQQFILLDTMDNKWKDHLFAMEVLKHGIGVARLRADGSKERIQKRGIREVRDAEVGDRRSGDGPDLQGRAPGTPGVGAAAVHGAAADARRPGDAAGDPRGHDRGRTSSARGDGRSRTRGDPSRSSRGSRRKPRRKRRPRRTRPCGPRPPGARSPSATIPVRVARG